MSTLAGLLLLISSWPRFWSLVAPDPGVLSEGKTHLLQARELARHPRYGLCWTGVLEQLEAGCKELDEEEQSRIALAFAHCHLERSGKRFPPCPPASSIRDCTQDMDSVAFGVYTEFFTHAQSICYFLQNEVWQQRAQDTVLRLTSASEDVAHQLESTHLLAEETARAQQDTLRSQEQILRAGELLRQTLQDSSQGVRQAFQDLQESSVEQRVVFAEIFNHVAFLHRFVVGKSNAVYSVLFHLMSVAVVLALTSSQRTSGARFILLALVGASVYLESVICSLLVDNSEGGQDLTVGPQFARTRRHEVEVQLWEYAVLGAKL
ncbi:protein brambleberry-like [Heteronotia binoei]|uniref:protein brambleberry-like n=1 Tax=Heteronotia binoei TaxID=13085 RepID=UPI002931875A|nr:protein brambleberry-like [Heteronotia binoei]